MASAFRFYDPNPQFVLPSGAPRANGTLTFLVPSSSPTDYKNTYPTQADALAGTNANTNPITLDSLGSSPVEIWMVGEYRVILKTSAGATVWDRDPYTQTQLQNTVTINTVADLRATEGTFDGETVTLSGYYAVGDAPSRIMYWDAASVETDDGGRIFKVTAVTTGRWKSSQNDFMDVRWWGLKLDNVTDDYARWDAMLNSALRVDADFFSTKHAGTFLFPDVGISYCSQTLHLKSTHTLLGGGSHKDHLRACHIRFPVDQGGVVFHHYNTDSTGTVAYGSTSSGSVWDGVSLQGGFYPSSTGTTGHGIWLRARAILRNCHVRGFAENGIHIVAAAGSGGFTEGNANNFSISDCRADYCGGIGLNIDGADANAGATFVFDASSNDGIGVMESAFLGNSFFQTHTGGNLQGYYSEVLTFNSVWVNPYSESDQAADYFSSGNLILGNQFGVAIDSTSTGVHLRGALGQLRNNRGFESEMESSGGDTVTVRTGGDPNNGDILYVAHETLLPSASNAFRITVSTYLGSSIRGIFANSASRIPWLITGPATTLQFGRSAIEPYRFAGGDGLWTRANSAGRILYHNSAAPTSGEWGDGDVIFHNAPVAGASPGWVCTTAGTAGSTAVFSTMAVTA